MLLDLQSNSKNRSQDPIGYFRVNFDRGGQWLFKQNAIYLTKELNKDKSQKKGKRHLQYF